MADDVTSNAIAATAGPAGWSSAGRPARLILLAVRVTLSRDRARGRVNDRGAAARGCQRVGGAGGGPGRGRCRQAKPRAGAPCICPVASKAAAFSGPALLPHRPGSATAHFKRPKVTMARVPVETNKTQAGPRAMSAWRLTLGFLGMAVPG